MFLIRNTASQVFTIPGALLAVADGSAVTSGTIYVSKDGTTATGGGTLTHWRSGVFNYTPTQAETDCKVLGYVLEGTGAIPVSGSIRTTGADPNDGVRLGMTALPNAAANSTGGLYTLGGTGVTVAVMGADVINAAAFADDTAYDGVADSVGATSITLETGNRPSVDISGWTIRIWSATAGAGQVRTISAYNTSTGQATVAAWNPSVTGTTITYRLDPPYSAIDPFAPATAGVMTGTVTTTSIPATGVELSSTDDAYLDQYLVPVSGVAKGIGRLISDYVGSTKTFTTSAFPAAPSSGDRFVVLGRLEP